MMNSRYYKILGLVLFILLTGTDLEAQAYRPTTTWPYLFEDFQEAFIYSSSGTSEQPVMANLHLEYCTLHYLDGDKIIQADSRNIVKVILDKKTFIYMNGELVQIIGTKQNNALVKRVKIDPRSLETVAGNGAYGMGVDVSASKKVRSLQIGGISNMVHSQMKIEQNEGREVGLDIDYFFLLKDGKVIIEATKKDVEKSLTDASKDKLKAFIKQNKIKWKDENSLVKLLDFLN